MYKLSSNQVAIECQQKICSSLLKLLCSCEWEQITVTGLCREAGVSRNAFYRNFETLDDVLACCLDEVCIDLVRILPREVFSEEYIAAFFSFWLERREVLSAFFQTHHTDMLMVRLSEVVEESSSLPKDHRDHTPIKGMVFYTAGLIGMLFFWVRGDYQLDPKKVARWLTDNIRYSVSMSGDSDDVWLL